MPFFWSRGSGLLEVLTPLLNYTSALLSRSVDLNLAMPVLATASA